MEELESTITNIIKNIGWLYCIETSEKNIYKCGYDFTRQSLQTGI